MNKDELKRILDSEGFSPRAYSLDGGLPNDRLCLSDEGGQWCVYYSERGERFDEQGFDSESGACEHLLRELRSLPVSQTRLSGWEQR
jgi:hypothetical protein